MAAHDELFGWRFPDPAWTTKAMPDRTERMERLEAALARHQYDPEGFLLDEDPSEEPDLDEVEFGTPGDEDFAAAEMICELLSEFGLPLRVELRFRGEHDIPLDTPTPALTLLGMYRSTHLLACVLGPESSLCASSCGRIRAARPLVD